MDGWINLGMGEKVRSSEAVQAERLDKDLQCSRGFIKLHLRSHETNRREMSPRRRKAISTPRHHVEDGFSPCSSLFVSSLARCLLAEKPNSGGGKCYSWSDFAIRTDFHLGNWQICLLLLIFFSGAAGRISNL